MANIGYSLPHQPEMQAEVILASQGPNTPPLYTIRLRYPRIIHGEIMTHRVFSRNARSSRAVPVKTMLNEVRNTPFVPWHWGKNQKGMQAAEECDEPVLLDDWVRTDDGYMMDGVIFSRDKAWLRARDRAVEVAEAMMNAGYHKQIPNRLLEPFSWIDTLITATDWANFLHLRDHKDAEPHLQDLARLVRQTIEAADIQQLGVDEWHLPYITTPDIEWAVQREQEHGACAQTMLCEVSAARCARISYAPFDGDASYEREFERYNLLVTHERIHASPLEHQAKVDTYDEFWEDFDCEPLRGNFAPGWVQFRKTIAGEAVDG